MINKVLTSKGELVARDVINNVRQGKKPDIVKVHLKHGYSQSSAIAVKATKTQGYKRVMKTFEDKIKKDLEDITSMAATQIKERLAAKETVTLRDLAYVADLSNKNLNLVQGKATERVENVVQFTDPEQARKYIEESLSNDKG